MKNFLFVVLFIAFMVALDFAVSALLVKGVCWAFGFTFSWKLAFGVWLIILIVHAAVTSNGSRGK